MLLRCAAPRPAAASARVGTQSTYQPPEPGNALALPPTPHTHPHTRSLAHSCATLGSLMPARTGCLLPRRPTWTLSTGAGLQPEIQLERPAPVAAAVASRATLYFTAQAGAGGSQRGAGWHRHPAPARSHGRVCGHLLDRVLALGSRIGRPGDRLHGAGRCAEVGGCACRSLACLHLNGKPPPGPHSLGPPPLMSAHVNAACVLGGWPTTTASRAQRWRWTLPAHPRWWHSILVGRPHASCMCSLAADSTRAGLSTFPCPSPPFRALQLARRSRAWVPAATLRLPVAST